MIETGKMGNSGRTTMQRLLGGHRPGPASEAHRRCRGLMYWRRLYWPGRAKTRCRSCASIS